MAYIIHMVYIHMAIPYRTTKFKSANTFISAAQDQTAKLKDRQYFWLYGIFGHGHNRSSVHDYITSSLRAGLAVVFGVRVVGVGLGLGFQHSVIIVNILVTPFTKSTLKIKS